MKQQITAGDFQALHDILNAQAHNTRGSGTRLTFVPQDYPNIRVEVEWNRMAVLNGAEYYISDGSHTHYRPANGNGYDAIHFTGKGSRDFSTRKAVRRMLQDLTGLDSFMGSWE